MSKPREAAFLEPPLMAPQCSYGAAEGSRHVVLIGPALFDEVHHRECLGHVVADGVLREDNAASENHAVIALCPDHASVVDDDGACRLRQRREKIVRADGVRHG
jgi:hypothetical protein